MKIQMSYSNHILLIGERYWIKDKPGCLIIYEVLYDRRQLQIIGSQVSGVNTVITYVLTEFHVKTILEGYLLLFHMAPNGAGMKASLIHYQWLDLI